jgi:transcriptional regulator with XRE-family HTH domain
MSLWISAVGILMERPRRTYSIRLWAIHVRIVTTATPNSVAVCCTVFTVYQLLPCFNYVDKDTTKWVVCQVIRLYYDKDCCIVQDMKNSGPRAESQKLAAVLRSKMEELGLSLRDLENATDLTYEYLRRILLGKSHPSDEGLTRICKALKLPYEELRSRNLVDKMVTKFADTALAYSGYKNPDLALLDAYWTRLTPEERNAFTQQIKAVASRRKK